MVGQFFTVCRIYPITTKYYKILCFWGSTSHVNKNRFALGSGIITVTASQVDNGCHIHRLVNAFVVGEGCSVLYLVDSVKAEYES
jgi:hypothetical protein